MTARKASGVRGWLVAAALGLGVLPAGADGHRRHAVGLASPANKPVSSDDQTFRPTVLIRKGTCQGSGSVIASLPGETLVLTVAHVVQEPGDLLVELHKFNLGVEQKTFPGEWPRQFPAEVVAADAASDVALVRVRGLVPLPYVAALAEAKEPAPRPGTVVTSVGIDRATSLTSWSARVLGTARLDPRKKGTVRRYLITDHAPDHGRSGGGLFRTDGRLVGVCVGRIDPPKSRAYGVFASAESVYELLDRAGAAPAITQSAMEHRGKARRLGPPAVTETTHRPPTPAARP